MAVISHVPKYINDEDWTYFLEHWATPAAVSKSISAASSCTSAPPGKKMHKHCADPNNFARIEYNMMVEEGLDEPPPFTKLVRRTHTKKGGTFVDERAEALVLEVEQAVAEMTNSDGSPNGGSNTASDGTTAPPINVLLDQEYLKRGQKKKEKFYGEGSVHLRHFSPSEKAAVSLKRNLDMELRMSSMEKNTKTVKADIMTIKGDVGAFKAEFKEEMAAQRASLNVILQALGVNPTTQQHPNFAQLSVPAASTAPAQPQPNLTPDQQSDLEEWCARELDQE